MGSDYASVEIHNWNDGHPIDRSGHFLDVHAISSDGRTAEALTDPYGILSYIIGSNKAFICFDFHVMDEKRVLLHSVVNSEPEMMYGTNGTSRFTASFISDFEYHVVSPDAALSVAEDMIANAIRWCDNNNVKCRHYRSPSQFDWFKHLKSAINALG